MQIDGAVAVVSGGASGLGLATVRRLVDGGAQVAILDLPTSKGADIERELDGVRFLPTDVTDEAAVEAAVATAAEMGPLSIAVNCAGMGPGKRLIGRDGTPADLDWFRRTLEVNLVGTFNLTRFAAAQMVRRELDGEERGVVVNTASAAAYDGQIGQVAYAAAKGGIASMTLPLARDLASSNIRVVTVAPGLFRTPLLMALPEEALDSLGAQVPHPSRLGEPDEYARLVLAIIDNPMLNGETIRLDGAIRMAPR